MFSTFNFTIWFARYESWTETQTFQKVKKRLWL